MFKSSGSSSEKINLITRITNQFRKVFPERLFDFQTSERTRVRWDDSSLIQLKSDRHSKYSDYDRMDDDIVELSSALDIYADFSCYTEGPVESIFIIDFGDRQSERLSKIIDLLENRLALKSKLWYIARNVSKYGDSFYENIATKKEIVKLKYLDALGMFVNYGKDNEVNKSIPYIQKDLDTYAIIAEFAPWEIVHFRAGSESDYGVNYSILAKTRRAFRVLRMLEDTLVVTRVARANQRGVHYVDVSGLSELEAARHVARLKIINKRKRYFDSEGKLRTEINPLSDMEDIWLPQRKGGVNPKYEVVGGERHLGTINDVEHFHNKLFAATKVPKAFLGFERDVNAKATLVQQNDAFVRVVKRIRHSLARGLRSVYDLEFLLHGLNPKEIEYKIKFSSLGSADEDTRWRVEKLKAETAKVYGDIGLLLPPEWIVRKLFLNLSPSEADSLLDMIGDERHIKKAMARKPKLDKGNGKERLSSTELDNVLLRIEGNESLSKIVKDTERSIRMKLHGGKYEYY